MTMSDYVYARQVPAEFQECDLVFLDEGGIYDAVIMTGNDRMNSHNFDLLRTVENAAEDAINVYEDISYNNSDEKAYSDVVDMLNEAYATDKHPQWTIDEAKQLMAAYESYIDRVYHRKPTEKTAEEYNAELLSLYTGEKYATTTIKGYCQGDWQTVYYPKEQYDDQDIEDLETLYFNTGSEWIVHDGTEPPETPEDIEGYSIYVLRDPRKEIAAAEGVTPDKVILYECERVMRTVYHESSDNPKAKVVVERD